MDLIQRIEEALKGAIRERDETRRDAVRMLLTVIKVKEKELRRMPGEAEIQQLIASQIKQRRDAAEQYRAGSREDLALKEEGEIEVLRGFLPEQMGPEALEALVEAIIRETAATSPRDMGKVMKALMPKVAGRADGQQVQTIVKQKLASMA